MNTPKNGQRVSFDNKKPPNNKSNNTDSAKVPAMIIGGALIGNLIAPGIGGAIFGGLVGGLVGSKSSESKKDK
jgi:hypothetical protein